MHLNIFSSITSVAVCLLIIIIVILNNPAVVEAGKQRHEDVIVVSANNCWKTWFPTHRRYGTSRSSLFHSSSHTTVSSHSSSCLSQSKWLPCSDITESCWFELNLIVKKKVIKETEILGGIDLGKNLEFWGKKISWRLLVDLFPGHHPVLTQDDLKFQCSMSPMSSLETMM